MRFLALNLGVTLLVIAGCRTTSNVATTKNLSSSLPTGAAVLSGSTYDCNDGSTLSFVDGANGTSLSASGFLGKFTYKQTGFNGTTVMTIPVSITAAPVAFSQLSSDYRILSSSTFSGLVCTASVGVTSGLPTGGAILNGTTYGCDDGSQINFVDGVNGTTQAANGFIGPVTYRQSGSNGSTVTMTSVSSTAAPVNVFQLSSDFKTLTSLTFSGMVCTAM